MVGGSIGILLAMLAVMVICVNYIGMVRFYPESDSSYRMVRETFGMDHAFFTAWALLLAYICILSANASAMGFLGRIIYGDHAHHGISYQVMGYDICLYDLLLSVAVIVLAAFLLRQGNRLFLKIITALSILLILCIVVMFAGVFLSSGPSQLFKPHFSSVGGLSKPSRILAVAVFAPGFWRALKRFLGVRTMRCC